MKNRVVEIARTIDRSRIVIDISIHIPSHHKLGGEIFRRSYNLDLEIKRKSHYGLPFYSYQMTYNDSHYYATSPNLALEVALKVIEKDARKFVKTILNGTKIKGHLQWPINDFSGNRFWVLLY